MLALYRSGRQAEALEAYRAARRELVEELGLEPGAALQELERAILRQDAALDAPPLADRAGPITLPDELRLDVPTFVGRKEELAVLTSTWQSVVRGSTRIVLVRGEAGTGKTRLVAQLARLVDERGATVLYANCGPRKARPGRAVVEALRHGALTLPDP